MKRLMLFCVLAGCCAAISTNAAAEEEKYTLKLRYPPGTYDFQQVTDMSMKMIAAGAEESQPMSQNVQTMEMKVVADPFTEDGTQRVSAEVTRIKADMNNIGIKISLDTDKDLKKMERNPMYQSFAALIGWKITSVYDKDGNVIDIQGYEELFDRLMKQMDSEQEKLLMEKVKTQIKDMKLEKAVNFGNEFYPDKPVAVGETWEASIEQDMPMIGKTQSNAKCTLESVETVDGVQIATLKVNAVMTSEEGSELDLGPINMKISKMNACNDTLIKFDLQTGLPIFTETVSKQRMTIGGEPTDETVPMPEISMNMEIEATSRTSLKKAG